MAAVPTTAVAARALAPWEVESWSAAAASPTLPASAELTASGRLAVHGQAHHEELRVVGTTLYHCDLAQQVVLARYTVPAGTVVGPGLEVADGRQTVVPAPRL